MGYVTSMHKVIFSLELFCTSAQSCIYARLGQCIILGNLARCRGGFSIMQRYFLLERHVMVKTLRLYSVVPFSDTHFPCTFFQTFMVHFAVCLPISLRSLDMPGIFTC